MLYVTCYACCSLALNEQTQIYCLQISAYTSRSAFSEVQPMGHIWPGTYFCKFGFVGTQPHQFIYILSMAALGLQQKRGLVVTQPYDPKS